jgi:hypothetical protein
MYAVQIKTVLGWRTLEHERTRAAADAEIDRIRRDVPGSESVELRVLFVTL